GNIPHLLAIAYNEWKKDKAPRLGAALAYYAVFSIPPLLLIIIAGIRTVYRGDFIGGLENQFAALVSRESAHAMLQAAQQSHQKTGILAGLIGLGILLFGAAGVFAELKDALNTIWGVQPV